MHVLGENKQEKKKQENSHLFLHTVAVVVKYCSF